MSYGNGLKKEAPTKHPVSLMCHFLNNELSIETKAIVIAKNNSPLRPRIGLFLHVIMIRSHIFSG